MSIHVNCSDAFSYTSNVYIKLSWILKWLLTIYGILYTINICNFSYINVKMVNYCFALPFTQIGLELAKKFAKENTKTKEHDEFYKLAGISREQIWIQRSLPGSSVPDIEIISIETHDPADTVKEFATSSHPWAVKFREFAKEAFGIDFSSNPPALNENIVDWKQRIGP